MLENVQDMVATRHLCDIPEHLWSIEPKAISANVGSAAFCRIGKGNGHAGWGRIEAGGETTVQTTTLDSELDRLGISSVDVLKIDIEGHETAAIEGMNVALADRRIRHILLEVHPEVMAEDECSRMIGRLTASGYRGWRIREEACTPRMCRQAMRGRPIETAKLLDPFPESFLPRARIHTLWSLP
jgi:FkbM family methyltransferase